MKLQEISITEIENVKIGNAENLQAGTGLTVVISERCSPTGLDVRGGGPASRESELTKPVAASSGLHAVVLGGGSAFGLDAAGGVMSFLEEKGIGYDVGVTKVPLVAQSDLFDLTVGDYRVRPDAAMASRACEAAFAGAPLQMGCHGAGTGATVGKMKNMPYCMKSGLGSYAFQIGDLKIGALVAVNSLGNIYDYDTNAILAGALTDDRKGFEDITALLAAMSLPRYDDPVTNTTIGIVITNAAFDKTQMNKVASMAHNGYARTIHPVHTNMDGDSIYAMSCGDVTANLDAVGTLAAYAMGKAVNDAVRNADGMYGFPSMKDLRF